MLTNQMAHKLLHLVNSDQWKVMEEYLKKVQHQTTLELAKAQSDQTQHMDGDVS